MRKILEMEMRSPLRDQDLLVRDEKLKLNLVVQLVSPEKTDANAFGWSV
jgi:hypothetical protein